ncbi:hypothetical protein V8E54_015216 [Elaphomyces granulatus]
MTQAEEFVVFPPHAIHLAHQLLHFHVTGLGYSHTCATIGYVVESIRQGVNFNSYWPVDRSALSNAIKTFHSLVFPLVARSSHFRKREEKFLAQPETFKFPNRPLGFPRGQAPKDQWVPKEVEKRTHPPPSPSFYTMPEPLSDDRIRAIVADAVAAAFARNISPEGPQGPPGPLGPSEEMAIMGRMEMELRLGIGQTLSKSK